MASAFGDPQRQCLGFSSSASGYRRRAARDLPRKPGRASGAPRVECGRRGPQVFSVSPPLWSARHRVLTFSQCPVENLSSAAAPDTNAIVSGRQREPRAEAGGAARLLSTQTSARFPRSAAPTPSAPRETPRGWVPGPSRGLRTVAPLPPRAPTRLQWANSPLCLVSTFGICADTWLLCPQRCPCACGWGPIQSLSWYFDRAPREAEADPGAPAAWLITGPRARPTAPATSDTRSHLLGNVSPALRQ